MAATIMPTALNADRHPEVLARSASLEGCTATQVGSSRLGHLKVSISGRPEIDAVAH
jgi:hypothetical protein